MADVFLCHFLALELVILSKMESQIQYAKQKHYFKTKQNLYLFSTTNQTRSHISSLEGNPALPSTGNCVPCSREKEDTETKSQSTVWCRKTFTFIVPQRFTVMAKVIQGESFHRHCQRQTRETRSSTIWATRCSSTHSHVIHMFI